MGRGKERRWVRVGIRGLDEGRGEKGGGGGRATEKGLEGGEREREEMGESGIQRVR